MPDSDKPLRSLRVRLKNPPVSSQSAPRLSTRKSIMDGWLPEACLGLLLLAAAWFNYDSPWVLAGSFASVILIYLSLRSEGRTLLASGIGFFLGGPVAGVVVCASLVIYSMTGYTVERAVTKLDRAIYHIPSEALKEPEVVDLSSFQLNLGVTLLITGLTTATLFATFWAWENRADWFEFFRRG